jgi:dTDP-4-dehydrorhamnose 3,5-epimerase-like enzyme
MNEDRMTSLRLQQRPLDSRALRSGRPWKTVEAPEFRDARGALTVCQPGECVPFDIARVYFVHGVPPSMSRGGHAHRRLEQVMFAISGRFRILLDDGFQHEVFDLCDPSRGLYTAPMVWRQLDDFSEDAVCMVLASERYDPAEYIHFYEAFLREGPQRSSSMNRLPTATEGEAR